MADLKSSRIRFQSLLWRCIRRVSSMALEHTQRVAA
uniref:Predicted protein n=1 Tax=Hordeum vulgare subsp. vulgare TaxID=112509 RepID=F2E519_HORVV|nr:predicted protein [Hordeum vulgare subsp. vulgare]